MDRWSNKVAIVTGVSSGIGKTIVKSLLKNGMVVVGIARREDLIIVSLVLNEINNGESMR